MLQTAHISQRRGPSAHKHTHRSGGMLVFIVEIKLLHTVRLTEFAASSKYTRWATNPCVWHIPLHILRPTGENNLSAIRYNVGSSTCNTVMHVWCNAKRNIRARETSHKDETLLFEGLQHELGRARSSSGSRHVTVCTGRQSCLCKSRDCNSSRLRVWSRGANPLQSIRPERRNAFGWEAVKSDPFFRPRRARLTGSLRLLGVYSRNKVSDTEGCLSCCNPAKQKTALTHTNTHRLSHGFTANGRPKTRAHIYAIWLFMLARMPICRPGLTRQANAFAVQDTNTCTPPS